MRRGNDLNVFNVNLLNRMGERGNYEKYISFVFIFIMGVIFSLILVSSLILTGDTTYNSTNQNITNRAGRAWLNISDVSPYDSLVAYYPFDADNITNVTSGNPTTTYDFKGTNDGTYIGANITLSGVYDDAVSFDGVNDYVNTDSNFPIVGAQNRTMAVWFKTNIVQQIELLLVWENLLVQLEEFFLYTWIMEEVELDWTVNLVIGFGILIILIINGIIL